MAGRLPGAVGRLKADLSYVPPPLPDEFNVVSGAVVDAAFAVHKTLGPGLLESVYETCLAHECSKKGLAVQRQVVVPIVYDGHRFDDGLRLDLLVDGKVVIELKAVDVLQAVHRAQVLTYLKLAHKRLGLLINFNVPRIKDGIQRIVL